MKKLLGGLAITLGVLSSSVNSQVLINVDGKEYTLNALMENCQSMKDNPAAQVACFNAVSALLDQDPAGTPEASPTSVPEAFEALRAAAQYEDKDSGLIIRGSECSAQIVYYGNYFHVSRRNVSSIDLFSTQFDASKVAYDQTVKALGNNSYVSRGTMLDGAVAATTGGGNIDSAQSNIAPKSARSTIADYAIEVADQLTPNESNAFDFVLVHPAKQQSSAEIWNAFEGYINACQ